MHTTNTNLALIAEDWASDIEDNTVKPTLPAELVAAGYKARQTFGYCMSECCIEFRWVVDAPNGKVLELGV